MAIVSIGVVVEDPAIMILTVDVKSVSVIPVVTSASGVMVEASGAVSPADLGSSSPGVVASVLVPSAI
jgi:hypothetical protein